MKKKMSFVEISKLFNGINQASLVKFKAVPKFRYALAKNRNILQPFMESLREAAKLPTTDEDINSYEEVRLDLIKEYDKRGKQVPPDKMEEFVDRLALLQENDHKEGFVKIEAHNEKMKEFTLTTEEVDLYMVEVEHIPEDLDDQAAVNDLFPILVDNED